MVKKSPFGPNVSVGNFHPVDPNHQVSPDFGQEVPVISRRRIDLAPVFRDKKVEVGRSNFIWARQASGFETTAEIKFNSPDNDPFPLSRGMFVRGLEFATAYISNDGFIEGTIDVITTFEQKGVFEIGNPETTLATSTPIAPLVSWSPDITLLQNVVTQIVNFDFNINNGGAYVTNLDTTTAIRINNVNVNAQGLLLQPLETQKIEHNGELYAWQNLAVSTQVAVGIIQRSYN